MKNYYMIHERENNIQYGLNTSVILYYFYKEHIFSQLTIFSKYIVQITVPPNVQIDQHNIKVVKNGKETIQYSSNEIIVNSKEKLTPEIIKFLIKEGADPNIEHCSILTWAARYGYIDLVKYLLPLIDMTLNKNEALQAAVKYNHIDVIKLLLPLIDKTHITFRWCYYYPSKYGYIEMLKQFLPIEISYKRNNYYNLILATETAIRNGQLGIIKTLIPFIKQIDSKNFKRFLKFAIKYRYPEIIKEFLTITDIDNDIIKYCNIYCKSDEIINIVLSYKKNKKSKKKIAKNI